jgi:predicted nucleic acid-binding protein
VASLVDTNILVYRADPRYPAKRKTAHDLLRQGLAESSVYLPHQAVVEFVAVVTRPLPSGKPLMERTEALRHAENLIAEFPVVYPNEDVVRTALRGMAAYQIPWYDAHLWAYAEHYGLREILSEDFEDGRLYGTVRVRNPFAGLS